MHVCRYINAWKASSFAAEEMFKRSSKALLDTKDASGSVEEYEVDAGMLDMCDVIYDGSLFKRCVLKIILSSMFVCVCVCVCHAHICMYVCS